MGVEREHLEGKVHAWETPQELPMPDSLLGKGLLSINLAASLLHAASHLPLGPLRWKGSGKMGNGRSPTAGASLGGPLGFRTLSQASPRCSSTGRSCSFAARGFPLCCCCSEEAVLTTSQRTWDICWCAACQRNPEQGHFPLCRTVVHQLQTGSDTHCSHPVEGGQRLGHPVLLCLIDLILRNLGFPAGKHWTITTHHRRAWVWVRDEAVQNEPLSISTEEWVRKITGPSAWTARVGSFLVWSD